MASLTQVALNTRKSIRYGIYLIILLIIARVAFNIGRGIYLRVFPPKPPPATVAFGKLPRLPFPSNAVPTDLNYTLETPDGKLPELKTSYNVYYMPPFSSTLGALDEARSKATRLGFDPNGRAIVENVPNVYIFNKGSEPSTLTMNIITGVFSISYDLSSDPGATNGTPPTPDVATQTVKNYLGGAGLLNESLSGPTTHAFQRLENGQFVPAIALSEANLIKINLSRKSYDEIPSVTPDPKEGNVWFLLAGGNRRIIAAEYHFFPIDEKKLATYPVKSANNAWEELKSNEGYIASYSGNSKNVVVRRVYLAYYDAGQYTEFYQPVVVFEGDNDFVAYVPAVTSEFYGAEPSTQ